jgi:hypothetical protein
MRRGSVQLPVYILDLERVFIHPHVQMWRVPFLDAVFWFRQDFEY